MLQLRVYGWEVAHCDQDGRDARSGHQCVCQLGSDH
jgi:hypothetical protein